MNDHTGVPNFSEDALLKKFKRGDFERAKAALLERYRMWHGILISNDEQSVITPDDLDHFRVQAADLLDQPMKSEYEWEQLKILTVLIYTLMDADKTALPGDNPAIQQQLNELNLPHADHYIMRRITHGAGLLDYADIESFVRYENLVLSSYITSVPTEARDTVSTIKGLVSREGVHFNLIDGLHEVGLEQRSDAAPEPGPVPEVEIAPPASAEPLEEHEPLILAGDCDPYLVNTLQYTRLNSGAEVTVASYVGREREHNEDAVIVHPANNQVIVIDAMGGYGNGVAARDVFVDAALKNPGNIDTTVETTQQQYDRIGLDQGGVCIINSEITAVDGGFRIDLAQAGDVHALLFDQAGEVKHETVDEAIGHQVINAIIGAESTQLQRENGWKSFGKLTRASLRSKPGWRLAVYSDGIANHFDAAEMAELIVNKTAKQAVAAVSQAVDEMMRQENAYRDNCSIAIIDF